MTMLAQFATTGGAVPAYIEDVFSAWVYTGNGSTQTITNNIDLSGKGGLVWTKYRASAVSTTNNILVDTVRGPDQVLVSNNTSAQANVTNATVFNSTGFTMGVGTPNLNNENNATYASWTFRKQAKFFDIVTYTGTGSAQNISHNLGSTPGCIIIKCTSASATSWIVYHRGLDTPATNGLILNATTQQQGPGITSYWNSTAPTSTQFTVNTNGSVNASGETFVAYLFAHDAGGFGLSGSENVISCGSFTTDGSGNASVTLGYEPQWVLTKLSSASANWVINDNMRGMPASQTSQVLYPNLANAESSSIYYTTQPNATGFTTQAYANQPGETAIYIAIRRGPMRTPTTGTSVYNAVARNGTGANATVSGVGFASDVALITSRNKVGTPTNNMFDRLRGVKNLVDTDDTSAEITDATTVTGFDSMDGVYLGDGSLGRVNYAYGSTFINWFFKRAPSFLDVVCYTGTGSNTTVTHNLAAVPELMLVRSRSGNNWICYSATLGNTSALILNLDNGVFTGQATAWNSTTPTSSVFSVGTSSGTNASATTYVAYLFASCPGVSKVGTYTGTATTQQINCGFTGGARFILIKRTDSTGDWYVYDSTRGISTSSDPYLLLNNGNAEVTSTDYIDPYAAGFELSSTAPAGLNASGGTYIFLAIA